MQLVDCLFFADIIINIHVAVTILIPKKKLKSKIVKVKHCDTNWVQTLNEARNWKMNKCEKSKRLFLGQNGSENKHNSKHDKASSTIKAIFTDKTQRP